MKICYIGAGSLFFESVSREIAEVPELHGASIHMYDPDSERAAPIAAVCRRYSDHFQAGITVKVCKTLEEALDGANAVISSIGVHGPGQAWHDLDVKAVAELGIMQTTGDTVGPTGVSQALRSIPPYLELAGAMEKHCPDAPLLNHSNPMGIICRAVLKHSRIRIIGYCHSAAIAVKRFGRMMGIDPGELDPVVAGVNHSVWLLSLRHQGKDVYPLLRETLRKQESHVDREFTMELLELSGLYLMGGDRHVIEFFPHARRPSSPENMEYGLKWRSNMINERMLDKELSVKASSFARRASGADPLDLPGISTPEAMGRQIQALTYGPDMPHLVNVANAGAIPNAPDWAVLEMKCIIGQHGAKPVHAMELPPFAARWTLAQIYANELIIEAAVEGSRQKAIAALACDPMVRDLQEAERVLDALVSAQGDRLAPFRK